MSLTTDMPTTIRAWSHSRWGNFEKCKLRAKLLYIDKLEEPRPPLRPGQTEYANDRGQRIHKAAELFVRGGVELIPELHHFKAEFEDLRSRFGAGGVSLEGEWAHNEAWLPVAYFSDDAWFRLAIDALVFMDPTWAVVIDYKSGRRSGNELKHAEQTQLYTVSTLLRYPEVQRVTTELWYVDEDDLARQDFTRDQGMRFFNRWNKNGLEFTHATDFPPNPNKFSCQYCRFGPKGSGVCTVGV